MLERRAQAVTLGIARALQPATQTIQLGADKVDPEAQRAIDALERAQGGAR